MLGDVPDSASPFLPAILLYSGSSLRLRRPATYFAAVVLVSAYLGLLTGCSRLRPTLTAQYVYVTAKETFLRDRVAAVSNRTATVENGERLEILQHGRRFYQVKTAKGALGWIDEKSVVTQEVYDEFQALGKAHASDPAVATAAVRDEVNMHLRPGVDSEHFFRLAEGDKLQLLERATLPKPVSGRAVPAKVAAKGVSAGPAGVDAPVPVAMDDWWLARDAKGRTGWLLARMVDVDAPDSISRYAEGQRIVGVYTLTTVNDPGANAESGAQSNGDVPIYLTLMGPPHAAGLPYDFDQVRVFTWNMRMHHYETAYREKNIEGFLPVTVKMAKDPYGKSPTAQTPLPSFTYRVLPADAPPVIPDPVTGVIKPSRTLDKTYRLEGNIVRRVQAPGSPKDDEAHPAPEEKKDKKGKKR